MGKDCASAVIGPQDFRYGPERFRSPREAGGWPVLPPGSKGSGSRLYRSLALNDLTLVGHSMGGGVALLVAMELEKRSSGRLHRLVLIDSICCPQRLPLFIRLLRLPLLSPFTLRIVPA